MKSLIPHATTHFVACSHEAGRFMFGDHRQTTTIKNAIDGNQFEYNKNIRDRTRKALGLKKNFVIGHVGRFTSPKNHAFIIDVLAEIRKKRADVVLMLVGEGELEDKIRDKVQSLGLSGNVLFMGSRDDVPTLMQAMDVFVLPSLYEGLGIVAIEAQANGLRCVVSTRVPREVQLSNICKTLRLQSNYTNWARYIASMTPSEDTRVSVDIGDYEVKNAHKTLQRFYIEALEGEQ